MRNADNLLELVGRTPVLRLRPFETNGVRLYAKLEGFNPTGSIKTSPPDFLPGKSLPRPSDPFLSLCQATASSRSSISVV